MDYTMRSGILEAATALGISPVDLATAISYETAGTFSPTKKGPTTQWGQHKGLIQFGEPQAKQFGVDFSSKQSALNSQLGADGAIVKYLKSKGVEPGMGLLEIYSAINAGGIGEKYYGRSDSKNNGAPGTVRDKVNNQMSGHKVKGQKLIGEYSTVPGLSIGTSVPSMETPVTATPPNFPTESFDKFPPNPNLGFSDSFAAARKSLGDKGTFTWQGKEYNTKFAEPQAVPQMNTGTGLSPSAQNLIPLPAYGVKESLRPQDRPPVVDNEVIDASAQVLPFPGSGSTTLGYNQGTTEVPQVMKYNDGTEGVSWLDSLKGMFAGGPDTLPGAEYRKTAVDARADNYELPRRLPPSAMTVGPEGMSSPVTQEGVPVMPGGDSSIARLSPAGMYNLEDTALSTPPGMNSPVTQEGVPVIPGGDSSIARNSPVGMPALPQKFSTQPTYNMENVAPRATLLGSTVYLLQGDGTVTDSNNNRVEDPTIISLVKEKLTFTEEEMGIDSANQETAAANTALLQDVNPMNPSYQEVPTEEQVQAKISAENEAYDKARPGSPEDRPQMNTGTGLKSTDEALLPNGVQATVNEDGSGKDTQGNTVVVDADNNKAKLNDKLVDTSGISGVLKNLFGLEMGDLKRALGFYLMSRATGASHAGSMRWAGGIALKQAESRNAEEKLEDKKTESKDDKISALVKAGYSQASAEASVETGIKDLLVREGADLSLGSPKGDVKTMQVEGIEGFENQVVQTQTYKTSKGEVEMASFIDPVTKEKVTMPLFEFNNLVRSKNGFLNPNVDTQNTRAEAATNLASSMKSSFDDIISGGNSGVDTSMSNAWSVDLAKYFDKHGYDLDNTEVNLSLQELSLEAAKIAAVNMRSGDKNRIHRISDIVTTLQLNAALMQADQNVWEIPGSKTGVPTHKIAELQAIMFGEAGGDLNKVKIVFGSMRTDFLKSDEKEKNKLKPSKGENKFYVYLHNNLTN